MRLTGNDAVSNAEHDGLTTIANIFVGALRRVGRCHACLHSKRHVRVAQAEGGAFMQCGN